MVTILASPTSSRLRRSAQAIIAQPVLAFGVALQVTAGLGVDPWTVFVQGFARTLHFTLGRASQFATGLLLVINYLLGREVPGWGTVLNMVLPGFAIDFFLRLLPPPAAWPLRLAMTLAGVLFVALGIAGYVRAGLGKGPVEGWVFAVARLLRLDVGRAKMATDAAFLVLGLILGGQAGIGTLLAALALGPLLRFFLSREPSPDGAHGTRRTG